MSQPRTAELLRSFDQAYDRKSWHGTTLRGSLRNLTPAEAAWRPAPGRHSAWELVVHCAYWKWSVLRRLDPAAGEFPEDGSNFFGRPDTPDERAYRRDVELLGTVHRRLRAAIEGLSDDDLERVPRGSKTTIGDLVRGVSAHDLYHAGQIQLLKRLVRPGNDEV
jgi:uncharacterized damage-inducible protein DinB